MTAENGLLRVETDFGLILAYFSIFSGKYKIFSAKNLGKKEQSRLVEHEAVIVGATRRQEHLPTPW